MDIPGKDDAIYHQPLHIRSHTEIQTHSASPSRKTTSASEGILRLTSMYDPLFENLYQIRLFIGLEGREGRARKLEKQNVEKGAW